VSSIIEQKMYAAPQNNPMIKKAKTGGKLFNKN
jgi:hypothetical protein